MFANNEHTLGRELYVGNEVHNSFDINVGRGELKDLMVSLNVYPDFVERLLANRRKKGNSLPNSLERVLDENYQYELAMSYFGKANQEGTSLAKNTIRNLNAGYERIKGFEAQYGGFKAQSSRALFCPLSRIKHK